MEADEISQSVHISSTSKTCLSFGRLVGFASHCVFEWQKKKKNIQGGPLPDASIPADAAKAAEDDVEQPAVEVLERADAAEARAPEPPADLGAVDTAEPAESEARVENSGDGDVGVAKDKTECQMDEILEDAPEATAPESEALSEAAAEEEDTSKTCKVVKLSPLSQDRICCFLEICSYLMVFDAKGRHGQSLSQSC